MRLKHLRFFVSISVLTSLILLVGNGEIAGDDRPFGLNKEDSVNSFNDRAWLRLLKAAEGGVQTVRLFVKWEEVEPSDIQWQDGFLEQRVRMAEAAGVEVVAYLGGTARMPSWLPAGTTIGSPQHVAVFTDYVDHVVSTFAGRIQAYGSPCPGVWDDPSCATTWLIPVTWAIHNAHGPALVFGPDPELYGVYDLPQWALNLKTALDTSCSSAEPKDRIDVVSLHFYFWGTPCNAAGQIFDSCWDNDAPPVGNGHWETLGCAPYFLANAIDDSFCAGRPFWIEAGMHSSVVTEENQAQEYAELYRRVLADSGVDRVYIHELLDCGGPAGDQGPRYGPATWPAWGYPDACVGYYDGPLWTPMCVDDQVNPTPPYWCDPQSVPYCNLNVPLEDQDNLCTQPDPPDHFCSVTEACEDPPCRFGLFGNNPWAPPPQPKYPAKQPFYAVKAFTQGVMGARTITVDANAPSTDYLVLTGAGEPSVSPSSQFDGPPDDTHDCEWTALNDYPASGVNVFVAHPGPLDDPPPGMTTCGNPCDTNPSWEENNWLGVHISGLEDGARYHVYVRYVTGPAVVEMTGVSAMIDEPWGTQEWKVLDQDTVDHVVLRQLTPAWEEWESYLGDATVDGGEIQVVIDDGAHPGSPEPSCTLYEALFSGLRLETALARPGVVFIDDWESGDLSEWEEGVPALRE